MNVYCVIGDQRVKRSLSPIMHNSVFSGLGLDSKYVSFAVEPDDLKNAVLGIKSLNISGANVTVPHKETIIPFLDGLSDSAEFVGAVNTLVWDGKGILGHNTDVGGFGDLLDRFGIHAQDSNVLIVGAGGATRAVLCSFVERGYNNVGVINRTLEKAVALTTRLGGVAIPIESIGDSLPSVTILVNTTSASDFNEQSHFTRTIFDFSRFDNLKMVVDINYGRKSNFWADLAKKHDVKFADGLYMLAAQARRSFHLWTGLLPQMENFLHPLGLSE
ncbi:MAG: shikimate dehydrogenase [Desulfomonilaceae bacterium]